MKGSAILMSGPPHTVTIYKENRANLGCDLVCIVGIGGLSIRDAGAPPPYPCVHPPNLYAGTGRMNSNGGFFEAHD